MKVSTAIFLIVVSLAIIGNLIYGLLLLETITSGTNIGFSSVFTNLFILWLMPVVGGLIVLVIESIKKSRKKPE